MSETEWFTFETILTFVPTNENPAKILTNTVAIT